MALSKGLVSGNVEASSGLTRQVSYTGPLPAAGSTIILSFSMYAPLIEPSITGVVDNQGNRWQEAITSDNRGTSNGRHSLWYAYYIGAPSGTFTVTVTVNASFMFTEANLIELIGVNAHIDPLDVVSKAKTFSTVPLTGFTGTPYAADSFVVAGAVLPGDFYTSISVDVYVPPYTEDTNALYGVTASRIISVADPQQCSWHIVGGIGVGWSACIAVFSANPPQAIARVDQIGRYVATTHATPTARFTQMARVVLYDFTCEGCPTITISGADGGGLEVSTELPTSEVCGAVEIDDLVSSLSRAAFLDVSEDWTIAGYAKFADADPAAYNTIFLYGDALFAGPYVWMGTQLNDGNIYLEFYDGSTVTDLILTDPSLFNAWGFISARYTAATHTIDFQIEAVTDSQVLDLSTFVFTAPEEYLLSDATGFFNFGLQAARWREWQARLTDGELALEARAKNAVRTTNLLADTPLLNAEDLSDDSGHGRDWTLVGSLTTVDGPGPLIGGVQ